MDYGGGDDEGVGWLGKAYPIIIVVGSDNPNSRVGSDAVIKGLASGCNGTEIIGPGGECRGQEDEE